MIFGAFKTNKYLIRIGQASYEPMLHCFFCTERTLTCVHYCKQDLFPQKRRVYEGEKEGAGYLVEKLLNALRVEASV